MTLKTKKLLAMLLCLALLGSFGAWPTHRTQALASIYYVDQNHAGADDNNDGSESSPWLTIDHATKTAVAGDSVYIKNGTYNEVVSLENSGTAGNMITFKAYPGHTPVLDGNGRGGWYGLISIYGQTHIRLEGLEIKNNDTGWGVLIEHAGVNPASHIELVDLVVHHTGGEAIQIRGNAHDILVQDCKVHDGATYSGIDIYQWDSGRPQRVTVRGCTAYNYPSFAGIASEQADNLIIENNVTYDNELGIDIGSGNDNVIKNNTIYNCATGIALSSNQDSEVYSNTLSGIHDEALYAYYWSANGEAHARNKWYNNTIHTAGFGVYESNQKGSSGEEGPTSGHAYYNNLFYNIGTHGSYRTPFHFEGTTELAFYNNSIYMNDDYDALELLDGADNADIRNNIFSVSGSGTAIIVGTDSSGATIDYNNYHNRSGSSTGPGAHSINEDPLFVSVATDDFHLQHESPCIDAATEITAAGSSDKDGVIRPQGSGWDIGAYEFAPGLTLYGTAGDAVIHLTWEINSMMPATSSWRINYENDGGTQTYPAVEIPNSSVRNHTLISLTNYVWYTVTLNGMLGNSPILTDSMRLMPSDIHVYLPLVLRN